MEFRKFKEQLQFNFKELTKDINYLFEVDIDKDELWNLYLDSFPEGTNEIYRERREYDCSCCRHFIKSIGNTVVIKDNKIKTIWDFETNSSTFQPVVDALSNYIKSKAIKDVWVNKFKKLGVDKNFEQLENGDVKEWTHLYLELPTNFVFNTYKSEAELKGEFRDTRNVFKRSLDEITEESISTVLELIFQNSLYRGEEWEGVLKEFLKHKKQYDKLQTQQEKDLYSWEKSVEIGNVIGRIRNHSIGTLLVNISENMDLDIAVRKYEEIVAPHNYKRSKPIYTKKMVENAKKKIEELGLLESLNRRYATLDDITVNDILFVNKDSAKRIGALDIFEEMAQEASINPKRFSKVEEVAIQDFVEKVLPTTKELEVLFENKHSKNLVSLIAPENKDSKSMFKWENGFGWAYTGNITDSSMKENVKSAGGKVDGVLRFSIQWNDDDYNPNDFDAHCIEPNGNEIYYGNKKSHSTTGMLDVDIINPERDVPAVENITWTDINKMKKGTYKFFVHNFSHKGGRSGFKAEIEFNGEIYSFDYNKELRDDEKVMIAEVTFDGNNFTIKEQLPSDVSSREHWNLKTNQFVPVSAVMYSPNYWVSEKGVGNKHYFFFLKNCINPEQPNGLYNEFLREELRPHRRFFEALSAKMRVADFEEQLSGLGFSSTRRNELIVKVKSNIERVIKVKF